MEFAYHHNGRNKHYTSVNGVISYDELLDRKLMLVKKLMLKQYGIEVSFRQEYSYKFSLPSNDGTSVTHIGYSDNIFQKNHFDILEIQYKPVFISVDEHKPIANQKLKQLLDFLSIDTESPFIFTFSACTSEHDFLKEVSYHIPVGLVRIKKDIFSNVECEKIQLNMLKEEKRWYEKLFTFLEY
jgi:hypothetical protein